MKRETFSRKDTAVHFLRQAASGKVQQACEHTTDDFIHHNAYFPADKESLMKGMAENAARFPDKTLDMKQVVEDGDLVAVLSADCHSPGAPGAAVVHFFRFRDGRIAEMWDVGQEVPQDSPNENGMF
jgi:predicted SnoaL-like aldol condensation-catalyzing enzyme